MLQDDYLMRQIADLGKAIARMLALDAGDEQFEAEADALATRLSGVSIATLDRLPAAALVGMLTASDTLAVERLRAVADLLSGMAQREGGALAESRDAKATALRGAADGIDAATPRDG